MTQRVWPPAFPLDPDARVLPAPLAASLASAGAVAPVILLVAGPHALEGEWAPQTAVSLAEAWSREGPRLVLADLGIGAPSLDRLVGEGNDEGLADVFLYGASLRRVIRGSATRSFGFIPAGTAPADSESVLTDSGWRQVVAHFFRDGAVLLCYTPWSAEGLSALATRLGAVIALATAEDLEALETTIPAEASILAVVGPPQAAAVAEPELPAPLPIAALPAVGTPETAAAEAFEPQPGMPEEESAAAEAFEAPAGVPEAESAAAEVFETPPGVPEAESAAAEAFETPTGVPEAESAPAEAFEAPAGVPEAESAAADAFEAPSGMPEAEPAAAEAFEAPTGMPEAEPVAEAFQAATGMPEAEPAAEAFQATGMPEAEPAPAFEMPPVSAEPEVSPDYAAEPPPAEPPEPWEAEAAPAVTEEDRRWMPPSEQADVGAAAPEPVEEPPAAEAGAEPPTVEGAAVAGPGEPGPGEEERRRARIPETPREALVEALWARRAGGPGRQGAAPQVDPVPGREVTEHERMAEPFVLLRDRHEKRHWSVGHVVLWVTIGAIVAILAILAYEVYVGNLVLPPAVQRLIPIGRTAAPAAAGVAKGGVAPQVPPVQAPVQADSLPFSVAIEAYPQYAPAVERAATLRREQSDVSFFVTPALDHGSIYYHVMAGPVADSLVAVALMQRLIDSGVKSGGSDFDIVATRLAFDLGEFASSGDAEARAAELAQKNIPTYVVEVPTAGGPSRWRLYAGAFQGAADANVLRPLLRGAAVPDSLVPRIGRSPK